MSTPSQPDASAQTLADSRARPAPTDGTPLLVVIQGPDSGRRFPLAKPRMVVGRDASADITLSDERTSRRHCALLRDTPVVMIEDLGSRNGTCVDGREVRRALLSATSNVQIGQTIFRVEFQDDSMDRKREETFRQATQDPITALANRFYFFRRAHEELALARRSGTLMAIVLLEIDRLAVVAEPYEPLGHDYLLGEAANLLRAHCREEDLAARYGDHTLALLLRGAGTVENVVAFCERSRELLAGHTFTFGTDRLTMTLSAGASARAASADLDLGTLLHEAEQALAVARRAGGNQTRLSGL